jgi:Arc/MetJ-type ribon-helix-helix transcriptional regulator
MIERGINRMKLDRVINRMKKGKTQTFSIRLPEDYIEVLKMMKDNGHFSSVADIIQALLDEFFTLMKEEFGDKMMYLNAVPEEEKTPLSDWVREEKKKEETKILRKQIRKQIKKKMRLEAKKEN